MSLLFRKAMRNLELARKNKDETADDNPDIIYILSYHPDGVEWDRVYFGRYPCSYSIMRRTCFRILDTFKS